MGLLTGWITGLVLLIMLAIILEMLLPNSSMRGYVKMVISLLILVAMLKPILSIFTVDTEKWMRDLQSTDPYGTESIETQINLQKSEIDEVRAAYISEQVADQLIEQAEETLRDTYSLEFTSVDVKQEMGQGGQGDEEVVDIHAVVRDVQSESAEQTSRSEIETVQIDLSKQHEGRSDSINLLPVKTFLSESWEIPTERITLFLEGGEQVDEAGSS
ncbi:stage III sporulation protein AF [Alkalicoccobacillus murimartini]|uniref:Stage III sporulation protein AF n=1 Tax=Alkalicoccobacillus murimartini TaxID=171685 RepID=A0ABT9YM71_9BACI|nr:stage III sporulation protein AF [Alkalicoccobacillus murimartini]MDQ0208968.1 stage III sporulation protein AF [Alkalicoccobacillus murimartini]